MINLISGGPASGGDSERKRKRYCSQLDRLSTFKVEKRFPNCDLPISFTEEDWGDVRFPHDDPIVLSLKIGTRTTQNRRFAELDYLMDRILVDTGSSADVLYSGAFDKLGLQRDILHPIFTPLVGFTGDVLHPLGTVELFVKFGENPTSVTLPINFLVVETRPDYQAYNAILGRHTLVRLDAYISCARLMMKFPTPAGIGMVRADQVVSRSCYSMALIPCRCHHLESVRSKAGSLPSEP